MRTSGAALSHHFTEGARARSILNGLGGGAGLRTEHFFIARRSRVGSTARRITDPRRKVPERRPLVSRGQAPSSSCAGRRAAFWRTRLVDESPPSCQYALALHDLATTREDVDELGACKIGVLLRPAASALLRASSQA